MNKDQRRAQTLIPGGQTPQPVKESTPLPEDAGAQIPLPFDLGTIKITEVLAKGGMGMTFLGNISQNPSQQVVVKIPLTAEPHLLEILPKNPTNG